MHILSVVGLLVLMLSGCSGVEHGVRKSSGAQRMDNELKQQLAGTGSVTLLDHQLVPIEYLKNHPEMKGLLINHYMGTGKTYLGIGFAQLFPDRPGIILAPRFFESKWANSIESYGPMNPKRFTFVSYDDAPKKLSKMDLSNH